MKIIDKTISPYEIHATKDCFTLVKKTKKKNAKGETIYSPPIGHYTKLESALYKVIKLKSFTKKTITLKKYCKRLKRHRKAIEKAFSDKKINLKKQKK